MALSAPTLIQPQAATEPECYEGKRCTDPAYSTCVGNCYEQYGDWPEYCRECAVKLVTGAILVIGGIYTLKTGVGTLVAKVTVIAGIITGLNNVYTAIKTDCPECYTTYNNLINCIENCPCSQWEFVFICP